MYETILEKILSFFDYSSTNLWKRYYNLFELTPWVTNITLHSTSIRELLDDPNEHFDVVIMAIALNDAMLGIAHHFKAPIIGFTTLHATLWTNDLAANPSAVSYIPHIFLPFTDKMTMYERMYNVLFHAYEYFLYQWKHIPNQREIYEDFFPDPKPSLDEMRKNVSLILLNTHHSIHFPRSYPPNMVEIGGINVNRKDEPLSPEVQYLLDNATDGAIYFSLGTNVKFSEMLDKTKDDILKVFAHLKLTVIWKLDIENIPNKPANVYISKWFPQNAILAHPNTKIFISHGGLLSLTEAVYYGVPVIGIPFLVDQGVNIKSAEQKGYCIPMPYSMLNYDSFHAAIQTILINESYALRAKEISTRFRDQLMSPLDTAIYWTEYVIRHQGAPHLRSAGLDLNWWQYHSLDVFMFLFILLLISILCIKIIITQFFRFCRRKLSKSKIN